MKANELVSFVLQFVLRFRVLSVECAACLVPVERVFPLRAYGHLRRRWVAYDRRRRLVCVHDQELPVGGCQSSFYFHVRLAEFGHSDGEIGAFVLLMLEGFAQGLDLCQQFGGLWWWFGRRGRVIFFCVGDRFGGDCSSARVAEAQRCI